jgi:hypothetical protein
MNKNKSALGILAIKLCLVSCFIPSQKIHFLKLILPHYQQVRQFCCL